MRERIFGCDCGEHDCDYCSQFLDSKGNVMKSLFVALTLILLVSGCSKKYVTNVESNPETILPNDSVEAIIADENEFRIAQGQLPLSEGLTCSVGRFSVMPSLLPASVPTLDKVNFSYFGNFNQLESSSSDGLNVLPLAIRSSFTSGYMVSCSGQLVIVESGLYSFELSSDDGSKLVIDGSNLIVNDGQHGTIKISGSRVLRKGIHSFRLDFMQAGGNQSLILESSGVLVPAENFYR